MRLACPEAIYGQHGEPNTAGNCPYCGAKIAPARRYGPSRGTGSISHKEEDALDRLRYPRETLGSINFGDQDPELEPDFDSLYHDEGR